MKRYILLLLTALSIAAAANAQAAPDTITRFSQRTIIRQLPDGTTVIETSDAAGQVSVAPLRPDSARTITITSTTPPLQRIQSFLCGKPTRWSLKSGGFSFGWNFAPGHGADAPIEAGKSLEIGWFQIAGLKYAFSRLTSLSFGLGMDWKNYRITTPDYRFAVAPDDKVQMLPYPDQVSPISSRIKIFTLSVPVMLRQQMPFSLFGNRQWIAVGASVGYSPHGSLLTCWRDETGHKTKLSENKIGHRRWTTELVGMIGLSGDVGVYLRYQPQSLLRGAGQPHFKSLSTGLIFFY